MKGFCNFHEANCSNRLDPLILFGAMNVALS